MVRVSGHPLRIKGHVFILAGLSSSSLHDANLLAFVFPIDHQEINTGKSEHPDTEL